MADAKLTPENNIRPEGPTTLPGDATSDVPEERPRSDIELVTAATVINETIISSILNVPPAVAVHLPAIRDFLKELHIRRQDQRMPCVANVDFEKDCFALRAQINEIKIQTLLVFDTHPALSEEDGAVGYSVPVTANVGEMKANLKLAFRHLEDAGMRIGKAIQAFDGGESCYKR